jgi:hypothetical protein
MNHVFNAVIHAWSVRVVMHKRLHSLDPWMSLVNEFGNFGPQPGWNNHTFPEQNKSLLNCEELSVLVEPFEL